MKRQFSSMLKLLLVFSMLAGIRSNALAVVTDTISADSVDLWHSDFRPDHINIAPSGSVLLFSHLNKAGGIGVISGSSAFYLSADSILNQAQDSFSVGDILLGKTSFYAESGSATWDDSLFIFSFPEVPQGQYYIICVADDENTVAEVNEWNNINLIPVTVSAPYVDLFVTSPVFPDSVAKHSVVATEYSINNSGSVRAYGFRDAYFISTDTILDANDVSVGSVEMFVEAGGTTPMRYIFNVPDLPNGQYYLIYKTDTANVIAEVNENNNTLYKPFLITDPFVDLVAVNIAFDKNPLSVGNRTWVVFTETNAGTINAGAHLNEIYLSQDSLYDANDIFLGQQTIYGYAPNENYSSWFNVSIPDSIATGTYYFIGRTDASDTINEINEYNNYSTAEVNIVAPDIDFEVRSIDTLRHAFINQYFYVDFSIKNNGTTYANNYSLKYYLSLDSLYDNTDTLLGENIGYELAPQTQNNASFSGVVGSNVTPGEYYIIAVADAANSVTESNEYNNSSVVKISLETLSYDLAVSNVSVSDSVLIPGNFTTVSYTVANLGTSPIYEAVNVHAYLSADSLFSYNDQYLLYDYIYLYSGSITRTYTVQLPNSVDSSYKYIVFTADPYNNISEVNEYNNSAYISVAVKPLEIDFEIDNVVLSATTVSAGSVIKGSLTVLNNGGSGLHNYVQIYSFISVDSLVDYTDIQTGDTSFSYINPYDSLSRNFTVQIPGNLAAGSYYLITVVDYYNAVGEFNEYNNWSTRTLQVTVPNVDLRIKSVALNTNQIYPGSQINVSSYLHNRGINASAYTFTSYYISSDTTFNYSDYHVGTYYAGPVSGKDSLLQSGDIYIPYLPAGDYYLILIADAYNNQTETREYNNITLKKIRVKTPVVDIDIKNPIVSSNLVHAGDNIVAYYTVQNKSSQLVYEGYTGFYLSKDKNLSIDDRRLFADNYTYFLLPGTETIDSAFMSVPIDIAPGKYFLVYHVDEWNYYSELNEENNYAYKAITVLAGGVSKEAFGEFEPAASGFNVTIAPNPVQETIHVTVGIAGEQVTYKLYDLVGNEMAASSLVVSNGQFSIEASDLDAGIYVLQIESEGKTETVRVIKQ